MLFAPPSLHEHEQVNLDHALEIIFQANFEQFFKLDFMFMHSLPRDGGKRWRDGPRTALSIKITRLENRAAVVWMVVVVVVVVVVKEVRGTE